MRSSTPSKMTINGSSPFSSAFLKTSSKSHIHTPQSKPLILGERHCRQGLQSLSLERFELECLFHARVHHLCGISPRSSFLNKDAVHAVWCLQSFHHCMTTKHEVYYFLSFSAFYVFTSWALSLLCALRTSRSGRFPFLDFFFGAYSFRAILLFTFHLL